MGLKKKTRKAGKRDGEAPKVKFGRLYRDYITGFEGCCVGFTSFISGCDQVLIVPKVDKDGKHQYEHLMNQYSLEVLKAKARLKGYQFQTTTVGGKLKLEVFAK